MLLLNAGLLWCDSSARRQTNAFEGDSVDDDNKIDS